MLYRYVKAPVKVYKETSGKTGKIKKLLPSVMITIGSVLLANVAWPIIFYQLVTVQQLRREPIVSPLQRKDLITTIPNSSTGVDSSLGVGSGEIGIKEVDQVLGVDVDYTDARNWFPTADFSNKSSYITKKYSISIPRVEIENAEVIVGGESLEKSLIHFPGTSQPGQLGSPVIFGHSTLRQFYDPRASNSNRYLSIFSKIMTLKEGDKIVVDYDGIRYEYEVREKVIVKPEDVYILQQRLNKRELKLITCVPEGTYKERGIIIAELIDLN